MATKIQAIRGMNDILPEQIIYWQLLEELVRKLAARYGYQEIRTPIIEKTELFERSIGEITDIVEKEMYTFLDRNDESLTMRPEGTAGCVRAAIEHGLLHNQTQRLWYLGPLFRYEKPQKGRYRQFYQFGVEAFGFQGPDIDAEMIFMSRALWRELGIENDVKLQINSLGTVATRVKYRDALVNYFKEHLEYLDADSLRRIESNPLRILDSKNPALKSIIENAPILEEYLDRESEVHFEGLKKLLSTVGVQFTVNPHLVRGLDYYTGMVFEWITDNLGAQGTICAGGRYDNLVAELGGDSTPAVGFALGCERVIELLKLKENKLPTPIDVYFIAVGIEAENAAMVLAEKFRAELPGLRLLVNCGAGSFKSQFKRADKLGAAMALILGEDEVKNNKIAVKFLREEKEQVLLPIENLPDYLQQLYKT